MKRKSAHSLFTDSFKKKAIIRTQGVTAEYSNGKLYLSKPTLEGITRHTADFNTGERETRYEPFGQPEGGTGFPVVTNVKMELNPHEVDAILDKMRHQLKKPDYEKLEAHLRSIQAD